MMIEECGKDGGNGFEQFFVDVDCVLWSSGTGTDLYYCFEEVSAPSPPQKGGFLKNFLA